MGDSAVLQHSSLWRRCEQKGYIHTEHHLIGDSAYQLKPWLMKNYPASVASPDQRTFNVTMNSARSKIEHAHARLTERWRRLQYLDVDLRWVGPAIMACALLHNICQAKGDVWRADDDADARRAAYDARAAQRAADAGAVGGDSDSDSDDDAVPLVDASSKRDGIMTRLVVRRAARRGRG